ncbi:uncharacterized protein LOC103705559 isoform X2 [Phoenix dactylifera]|uniref:Uncharacterized protein LOC103705559 isoform X2 n=1 Tax=Phoenix dactylifera TaxID=42345 RepID=A0A8B9ANA6_PHODC|nr:uncharacterized protein LOC103705559 isoform X2 [Phoenix dactylifera]
MGGEREAVESVDGSRVGIGSRIGIWPTRCVLWSGRLISTPLPWHTCGSPSPSRLPLPLPQSVFSHVRDPVHLLPISPQFPRQFPLTPPRLQNPLLSNDPGDKGPPRPRLSFARNGLFSIPSSRSRSEAEKRAMERKSGSCAICENSNLASICAVCVNYRLSDRYNSLKSLKSTRDSLYSRLNEKLVEKKKTDNQFNWRLSQNEKLKKLRERLNHLKKQLSQEKAKVEEESNDLNLRYGMLDSAFASLQKNRVELLETFYTNIIYAQNLVYVNPDGERKDGSSGPFDQICNARLPRGLDPHSVPSEELAASLGYVVQLLNLVVRNLAAPALHNCGFAGSCSCIWQRNSYWDTHPSSQSKEYPLFIPRQNCCCSSDDNSWSDRSSSNFGVASVEPEDTSGSSSSNYSSASPHSVETHKDLQKGISLLNKSVSCITAYCYNSLCLDVPSEASNFEAFAKLLATLSSSRELRSVLSLKMACSRSDKEAQLMNRSVWNANSGVSSSSLVESMRTTIMPNANGNQFSNSATSFLCSDEMIESERSESLVEGWDIVEHPTFLPPP